MYVTDVFDNIWLRQINVQKLDSDEVDRNKLRFYKSQKVLLHKSLIHNVPGSPDTDIGSVLCPIL